MGGTDRRVGDLAPTGDEGLPTRSSIAAHLAGHRGGAFPWREGGLRPGADPPGADGRIRRPAAPAWPFHGERMIQHAFAPGFFVKPARQGPPIVIDMRGLGVASPCERAGAHTSTPRLRRRRRAGQLGDLKCTSGWRGRRSDHPRGPSRQNGWRHAILHLVDPLRGDGRRSGSPPAGAGQVALNVRPLARLMVLVRRDTPPTADVLWPPCSCRPPRWAAVRPQPVLSRRANTAPAQSAEELGGASLPAPQGRRFFRARPLPGRTLRSLLVAPGVFLMRHVTVTCGTWAGPSSQLSDHASPACGQTQRTQDRRAASPPDQLTCELLQEDRRGNVLVAGTSSPESADVVPAAGRPRSIHARWTACYAGQVGRRADCTA